MISATNPATGPAMSEAATLTGPACVTLEYFAQLRDEAGCPTETVTTQATTLATLYDECSARHGFSLPRMRLRVAVNAAFTPWDHRPVDGDHIVFIPPVSGG